MFSEWDMPLPQSACLAATARVPSRAQLSRPTWRFSHLNLNHLFDSRAALAPTQNTPRFSVLDDWDRHRCSEPEQVGQAPLFGQGDARPPAQGQLLVVPALHREQRSRAGLGSPTRQQRGHALLCRSFGAVTPIDLAKKGVPPLLPMTDCLGIRGHG
jgi:hypothetical protein